MTYTQPILAAIFDMDGLLIDSEPLWEHAEIEIFCTLGMDISHFKQLPCTVGLRIDQVVHMWYHAFPWKGSEKSEVTQRIIKRVIELVEEKRPLLPGVEYALNLCRSNHLKIGLASASPMHMLERILEMFNLRHYFDVLTSAELMPYSKPHPLVYHDAAEKLGINPLQCVALEDSLNGMIATKAARMRSIIIPAAAYRDDPRWSLADVQLQSLEPLNLQHLKG